MTAVTLSACRCMLALMFKFTLVQMHTRDSYPSPVEQPEICRRETKSVSFICDPDNILLPNELSQLDALLQTIAEWADCPCSSDSCRVQGEAGTGGGYKVGIALAARLSPAPRPTLGPLALDEGSKEVAHERAMRTLNEAMLYALALHARWKLGNCTEDVLILYVRDDNIVYTVTGRVARLRLNDNLVAEISQDARRRGFPDGPFSGLKTIAEGYRAVFMGRYVKPPQALTVRNAASATRHLPPSLLLLLCLILGTATLWCRRQCAPLH